MGLRHSMAQRGAVKGKAMGNPWGIPMAVCAEDGGLERK